jgi:anti-sigma B factor antagonist
MTSQAENHPKGGPAMTNGASFEVTEPEQHGVPVLNVRGEIDVSTSPNFQEALAELISRPPRLWIVNMADVSFIDSTGLGVLVGAVRDMRAAGGDLRLVVTQPQILKLLELTGLDKVFEIVSDAVTA